MTRRWLYHADCPQGRIFEGDDQVAAALKEGWVDSPAGFDSLPAPSTAVATLCVDVAGVALVAHEVNRAYCQALGDDSQPPWDEAPDWQRSSAIEGVLFHLSNPEAGAEASHENWLQHKEAEGWKHGETKDVEAKTHPCMVPFSELPVEQQAKDYLFRAVVHAVARIVPVSATASQSEEKPAAKTSRSRSKRK